MSAPGRTMDCIFIEELKVEASVGVYPREQVHAQQVEISMTFGVPDAAAQNDDLADTIDYAEVVRRIREELGRRHFNLLETLGEFVIGMMLDDFGASWARISIAKTGVMKGVRRVGVTIERGRDQPRG